MPDNVTLSGWECTEWFNLKKRWWNQQEGNKANEDRRPCIDGSLPRAVTVTREPRASKRGSKVLFILRYLCYILFHRSVPYTNDFPILCKLIRVALPSRVCHFRSRENDSPS